MPTATITISQLEMAVRSFEAMFDKVEYTTTYADDVVELMSGGFKAEGDRAPAYYASEPLAVRAWFEAAMHYRGPRPGSGVNNKLVWRIKPQLEYYDVKFMRDGAPVCDDGSTTRLWRVYSRLAVRSFTDPRVEEEKRNRARELGLVHVGLQPPVDGIPAQPGTPETDADPRNPNVKKPDYAAITKDIVGGG